MSFPLYLILSVGLYALTQEQITAALEQPTPKLCESKYCLLDAEALFGAMTKNKSVNPCEDFKEFSIGNFLKSGPKGYHEPAGKFFKDIDAHYNRRLIEVLEDKVNENDTRVTKAMKKFYAKCVDTDYVKRNAVNEIREYLKSFGLKFYPDSNQNDFDIRKYFEAQPFHAISNLLQCSLERTQKGLRIYRLHLVDLNHWFASYEIMLHNLFPVNANFGKIARTQHEFYDLQVSLSPYSKNEKGVWMSVDELNNLTSILNLDWHKIIDNQLITKLNAYEDIFVEKPLAMKKLAQFLAFADKKLVADFLVYDFLNTESRSLLVKEHQPNTSKLTNTKSNGRELCLSHLKSFMSPALTSLYSLRFWGENRKESIDQFIDEAKSFAVKKIKADSRWNTTISQDLINHVKSMKVVAGYPKEVLEPKNIDNLYSSLSLNSEQSFIETSLEIYVNHQKSLLEPSDNQIRKIVEVVLRDVHEFKYWPEDDTLMIRFDYLSYPFYSPDRPRFWNSATVGFFFFRDVSEALSAYLDEKYGFQNSQIFTEYEYESAYDFYDVWLKSGRTDLRLTADSLKDRQLFWVAAAQTHYQASLFKTNQSMHQFFFQMDDFQEAFRCTVSKSSNFVSLSELWETFDRLKS